MLLDVENNVYGVRYYNGSYFIGNLPVDVSGEAIKIGSNEYHLSDGLRELLYKNIPKAIFTDEDLANYRTILTLTNAHKIKYCAHNRVNSNSSSKYVNIISRLFPPKRAKKRPNYKHKDLQISPNSSSSAISDTLDELPSSRSKEATNCDKKKNTPSYTSRDNDIKVNITDQWPSDWYEFVDVDGILNVMNQKVSRGEDIQPYWDMLATMNLTDK